MTETIANPYADIVDSTSTHADAVDNSVVDNSGFSDRKPAREGVALFRLKSYIETGQHTVKKGQGKGKVQHWASVGFELLHPDHMIGEGDKAFPDTLELVNLNISRNEKAKYYKLFNDLNYTGEFKNFQQLLGRGFLGYIEHNKVGEKTYVNLKSIGAPRYEPDPVGAPGVIREVAVPPLHGDVQLFLFDSPGATAEQVQRMWDGIAITGDKSDGTPRKNWIQEKIRSAMNWEGSFVQSVVGGDAIVAAEVADDIAAATTAAADKVADPLAGMTVSAEADSPVDTSKAEAAGATVTTTVVDPLADIPGL